MAYRIAQRVLPDHSSKFSRKEYTLPQMFACLCLREKLRLSYRKTEAMLRDSPQWLADIGLEKPPDHNTLWRAFDAICTMRRLNRMLDLLAELFRDRHQLGLNRKPLAIDSTCYEPQDRSSHYERRCRSMGVAPGAKYRKNPGSSANQSRSKAIRRMPKLALAAAADSHLILSARPQIGGGSDAPDFEPLLESACKRGRVRTVVADSGYDSEKNHRIARERHKVRSIIPASIGRPSSKPPIGRWRRQMRQRFARNADRGPYGQRSQVETVNSMMKRNMGDNLRSRLPRRQKAEMLLRSVVHNIMLAAHLEEG